jgi:hypothetical protein
MNSKISELQKLLVFGATMLKAYRVGAQEPFHSRHQVGARRLYDEMEMIAIKQ